MTETQSTILPKSTRIWIASITLILCWIVTAWLVINGNPDNSLHQSALSWCFLLNIGILGGIGLGTVVDMIPYVMKK